MPTSDRKEVVDSGIVPDIHILGLARLAARFTLYGVRYCAVGGFATAMYLPQRHPDDLDIVIAPRRRDGARSLAALLSLVDDPDAEASPTTMQTTPKHLARGDQIVIPTKYGTVHILGDLLPAGCDRSAIVRRRRWFMRGGYRVAVCDLNDLLQIKQTARHKHDEADVTHLLSAYPRAICNPAPGRDT